MKIKVKFFNKEVYPEGLYKVGGKKSDWVDLRASEDVDLKQGELKYIHLGVAMQLPGGYEGILAPRSSMPKNFLIMQANSIGIFDETYCGDNDEWLLPVYAIKDTQIKKGERLCQFRIIEHQPELEFEEVETLGNPDRGGWGSTGKK